jgi:REP element-mobilizing transposase RayT
MAKVEHYYTRFERGEFYHVYNRSIDKKPMFKDREDNVFFLKKLNFFLNEVISIYAYNLLDNHFHMLIKINNDLSEYRLKHKISDTTTDHAIISKQFRRFFQSYTLTFNRRHNRCGTLFQTPFKRALVNDHRYLIHLIYYIHTNAEKHNLVENFQYWEWTSYHDIMANQNTILQKEILNWFGDKNGYINFHSPRINDFDNL